MHSFSRGRFTRRTLLMTSMIAFTGVGLAACGAPAVPTKAPEAPKVADTAKPAEANAAAAKPPVAAQPAAAGAAKKTLNYWLGPDDANGVNAKKKWLEEQGVATAMPTVTLEYGLTPGWPDFWSKLLIAVASGTAPDVVKEKEAFTRQLSWKKSATNLDPYIQKSGLKSTDFVPTSWEQTVYKNSQYSIPLEPYVMSFSMNDEVYTKAGLVDGSGKPKAPSDWKEWREQNKTLQKALPAGGFAHQYYEYGTREWNLMYFNQWLVAAGGKFWADDAKTKIDINSDAGIKAMQFLLDMVEDGTSQPPDTAVASDARFRPQYSGLIANWIQGPWAIGGFKNQAPNLKYTLALIPKDQRFAHPAMVDGHAIPKGAKNIDEAWELIRWFATPKIDLSYRTIQTGLPALKESLTSETITKDPKLAFFAQLAGRDDNVIRPFTEGWDEMAVAMSTELQAGFFKQKSPKDALNAAKKVGEEIAAKARAEG